MKKNSNQLLLNFVLCFLGFSIPMGLFLSLLFMSVWKGIILGVIGGLLFASVLVAFIAYIAAGKDRLKERYGIQEQAFYDGGASYIMDKVSVGGWMYLFEDRLCFLSHAINVQVGEIVIPYQDMTSVAKGTRWRRIAIQTKDGKSGEFVVNEADEWVEILQSRIAPNVQMNGKID